MAFVPLFTTTQILGLPNIITLTDTSTGSDVAITQRRVYLIQASNAYLVPAGTITNYIPWSYSDDEISINALNQDYALNISVQWLDVGNNVLYTKTILECFTQYGLLGSFGLTSVLSANPNTIQDQNYWLNRMILRCNIDDANQAISIGGNIFISQAALDRETYMLANKNLYF